MRGRDCQNLVNLVQEPKHQAPTRRKRYARIAQALYRRTSPWLCIPNGVIANAAATKAAVLYRWLVYRCWPRARLNPKTAVLQPFRDNFCSALQQYQLVSDVGGRGSQRHECIATAGQLSQQGVGRCLTFA